MSLNETASASAEATDCVRITSDTSSVLRLLSKTFSTGVIFVQELLQNARRAGATQISVTVDDDVFEIRDNGSGIASFDTLLAMAQSGWDASVQQSDAPYGAGFFSCLFAAERIEITSNGRHLATDTAHLLSLQDVVLERVEATVGTTIRLITHKRKRHDLTHAVKAAARGFSVPIELNGQGLDRPDALDQCEGWLAVAGLGVVSPKVFTSGNPPRYYLQGLPIDVNDPVHRSFRDGVVHLDSQAFQGRMPDRAELLDAAVSAKRIKSLILSATEAWLRQMSQTLPAEVFVGRYGRRSAELNLWDLLEAMPFIPAGWVSTFDPAYDPMLNSDCNNAWRCERGDETVVSRSTLEERGAFIVHDNGEDVTGQCFVGHKGAFLVHRLAPAAHWFGRLCQTIDSDDEFTVRREGDLGKTTVVCRSFEVDLHFAERVFLVHPVHGEVALPQRAGVFLSREETIYATPETTDGVVCQCDWFVDDDVYSDELEDDAREQYAIAANLHLNKDPAAALQAFLNKGLPRVVPNALRGTAYTVSIGNDGIVMVTTA